MDYVEALRLANQGYDEQKENTDNDVRAFWRARVGHLRRLTPPRKLAQVRALLACTILARATDPNVDIRVINGGDDEYGARSMADKVVCELRGKLDIGSTSPNPINGNTFVSPSIKSIDDISFESSKKKKVWQIFLELVEKLEELDTDDAFQAWKGYVDASALEEAKTFEASEELQLLGLSHWLAKFVGANPEGGVLGQTLVGACISAAYPNLDVDVGKINDPDRGSSGDVTVKDDSGQILLVLEVKQKAVHFSDVLGSYRKAIDFDPPAKEFIFCAFEGIKDAPPLVGTPSSITIFESIRDFISYTFLISPSDELSFCNEVLSTVRDILVKQGHPTYFSDLHDYLMAQGLALEPTQ